MTRMLQLLNLLAVAAGSVAIAAVSLWNLSAAYSYADLIHIARAIEQNPTVTPDALLDAVAGYRSDDVIGTCLDDPTKAFMSIRLAELKRRVDNMASDREIAEARNLALSSVNHRLACAPVDGNAWLYRAELLADLQPRAVAVKDALRQSYLYAPAEDWVLWNRFGFTSKFLDPDDADLATFIRAEIKRLVDAGDIERVAKAYVEQPPAIRLVMADMLKQASVSRQRVITAASDRLGVTITVDRTCPTASQTPNTLTNNLKLILSPRQDGTCDP